ncbi:hypothetical protein [Parasutterella excrementihominis]|uniref:hypothetical protein n=1 Tax=Parasutterella excrementihominis TaxID=487175 RepID=UPI00242B598D|nr:hypothetical protein [Parasutterella excrementihominis]
MAVQNVSRKAGPLSGNGTLKTFSFSFKAIRASDVVVRVSSGDGVADAETVPVYGTDYTVTLNSNQDETPGGSVTFVTAPASGTKVVVTSDTTIDQQLVLTNHDGFLPGSLNNAYDKLTIICQELAEALTRCLTVPITNDKTPQQVLKEILEIAATANEYAQLAQQIYATVEDDVAEIKALKAEIDDLVLTFQTIEQLAAQAQANAHSTNDDKITCQQALQQIQAIAAQTGFSTRTSPSVSENETFPLSNLTPSAYAKVGDLVLNSTNGDLFRITAVTATTATVGAKISNLRGPRGERGLQGSPGPAGSPGEQGPMGQSPYATCFGQFQVNGEGMLQLEYVGLAPAEFSINDNGEVEATYANT